MSQFPRQILADLARKAREIGLAGEVGAQLAGEPAVFGKGAALVVEVAQGLLHLTGDVALGVLVFGQVELLACEDVLAGHEVKHVQDGMVDRKGHICAAPSPKPMGTTDAAGRLAPPPEQASR
jgi:hypothetical protein